jgi:hypothetical protein
LPAICIVVDGAVTEPDVIVTSFPTSTEFAANVQLPVPLKVRLLNLFEPVRLPEISTAVFPLVIVTVALLLLNVPPELVHLPPTFKFEEGAVKIPPGTMLTLPANVSTGIELFMLLWNTHVSPELPNVVGCAPVLLFTEYQLVSTEASPPVVTEYQVTPPVSNDFVAVAVPQKLVNE